MEELANFDAGAFLETTVRLIAGFVLGGLIGFERQYRQRTAGLRTNALVALGYSDKEALLALKAVPAGSGVSDGIKLALKALSKG